MSGTLWDWTLAAYARPGVPEATLEVTGYDPGSNNLFTNHHEDMNATSIVGLPTGGTAENNRLPF